MSKRILPPKRPPVPSLTYAQWRERARAKLAGASTMREKAAMIDTEASRRPPDCRAQGRCSGRATRRAARRAPRAMSPAGRGKWRARSRTAFELSSGLARLIDGESRLRMSGWDSIDRAGPAIEQQLAKPAHVRARGVPAIAASQRPILKVRNDRKFME